MTKFIDDLKYRLKYNIPRSVIFWNGLVYLFFLISLICGGDFRDVTVGFISGFGSIIVLVTWMFGDDDYKYHLWIPLTMIFWFGVLIGGIIWLLYKFYERTIKPFNDWLDKRPTR